MIAALDPKTQVLSMSSARGKLAGLDSALHSLLSGGTLTVPHEPGRDVQILPLRDLPDKKGLSTREGQARLVHDLASIELQAMELGLRTLAEFPEAPREFREELAEVTRQEGSHFELCLNALDDLEMPWGSFPTHSMLWHSTAAGDELLDRIVIVHRYLEGSGLDASDTILRRLSGVNAREALRAVEVIRRDEVGHVLFGSRWHHRLVREAGGDFSQDLRMRLDRVFHRIPRRMEQINRPIRMSAGFLDSELEVLEEFRGRWASGKAVHPGAPP
jgi:uncharacterized ferritin-like protein (DUF455 family)